MQHFDNPINMNELNYNDNTVAADASAGACVNSALPSYAIAIDQIDANCDPEPRRMPSTQLRARDIVIKHLSHGYIVHIGCQEFAI